MLQKSINICRKSQALQKPRWCLSRWTLEIWPLAASRRRSGSWGVNWQLVYRLVGGSTTYPTQKYAKVVKLDYFLRVWGKNKKSLKPKPPMQIHKIFTGVPSKYSSEGNPPTRCASKETSRKTVLSPEAHALPDKTGKCVCVCAFFKFALTDLMGRGFFSTSDQKHPPKRSILHEVLPSHPPRSHQWCMGHERQKKTRDNIPNSEKAVCWRQHLLGISSIYGIAPPYAELSGTFPQLYLQPLPEPSTQSSLEPSLKTFLLNGGTFVGIFQKLAPKRRTLSKTRPCTLPQTCLIHTRTSQKPTHKILNRRTRPPPQSL